MKRRALIIILFILGIGVGFLSENPAIHQVNVSISHWLQTTQPRWFVNVNITVIVFEYVMVITLVPLLLYLFIKGKRKEAGLLLIAGLAWFVTRLLKSVFKLPCPMPPDVVFLYPFHLLSDLFHKATNGIDVLDAPVCYPSGHSFTYVSYWGMIFFLKDTLWKNRWMRMGTAVLCGALIALIGESLIAVGGHWFTDVIGGYAFGFAWLLLLTSS